MNSSSWKEIDKGLRVEQWLNEAARKLESAGIGSARLDALILLEDELSKDRTYLLAHPEISLQGPSLKRLERKIKRRAAHEPLAYIRGFTEFYGRRFKVNHRVLEPRPESETMIDLLKNLLHHNSPIYRARPCKIVDVGTGSGALGITARLELPNVVVDLFDIDASALAVARHNCALHELHLRSVKRDLLKNSHKAYDVILANLPYIPSHWQLHQSVKMEPKIALFGGQDGLYLYRRLFEQLTHFSWRPNYVLTESLPSQHAELSKIAKAARFDLYKSDDFIQIFTPGLAVQLLG